jgi:hypothetical protein
MLIKSITLGCDFEAFVVDKGQIIHADLLLPNATKQHPIVYRHFGNDYLITHDRKCIECSIPPFDFKRDAPDQFLYAVVNGVVALENFLKSLHPNYSLVIKDAITLDKPETWHKGHELNYYSGRETPRIFTDNIVSAGLHIHFSAFGYTPEELKAYLIPKLDWRLGLYYKIKYLFSKRRAYGKLGAYRDKKYDILNQGFEYRTLGGIMIMENNLERISKQLHKLLKPLV